MAGGRLQCVFSDLDGTLLHYYEDGILPKEVLTLPPSKTGRCAVISKRTLQLTTLLRKKGVKLIIISGVRYSTFIDRLPYIPFADAYCIENGGRIFYPKVNSLAVSNAHDDFQTSPDESQLTEDLDWRNNFNDICGYSTDNDKLDVTHRLGPLWDLNRRLIRENWDVDTHAYFTMLRIKVNSISENEKLLSYITDQFSTATNFGYVDVFSPKSGKKNVAAYLSSNKFNCSLTDCAGLGDDDNDIGLLSAMGKGAFITGFSSESIKEFSKSNEPCTVSRYAGVAAAEEMLEAILEMTNID